MAYLLNIHTATETAIINLTADAEDSRHIIQS